MAQKSESEQLLFSNMRTMISLVDRLRDFNLHEYISLPRITVLGDQSAGKSSILESICGLNFLPRGSGIVTRRPLELRLIRDSVAVPYFIFPKDFPGQKFVSQDEVRKKIEELTDKVAGIDKFISDTPIVLTVYSSTVPDLSLVDLPGITRVPTGKQPANIEEITKGLIRKYCADPNSLILCVVPANIDISTSDALLFARTLDPTGARTLGVLTKIDLMDEGTDCKKVLLNQEIPLRYGYVGVKGRSQKDITQNKTVADAINEELNFFARHPIYSTLPGDVLGTRALVDRLSSILFDMIRTALPKIKSEIMERKRKAREQLEVLGEDVPETEEKRQEAVFRMVRAFKENFDQEITGKYFHESLSAKNRRDKAKRTGETITFQLNGLFNALYEDYMAKDFRVTQDYTDEYIRNAMEVYQGDSMPGFQSFDSFLYLINPKMRLLGDPVFSLLEEAKGILESKGSDILEAIFKKYPRLLGEVRDTFVRELSATRTAARKILENVMRCNENYWFTNDSYMVEGPVSGLNKNTKGRDLMALELRNRIEKYFYIVVRNIRNTVPKIIGTFLLRRLSEKLEVSILNALARKHYMVDVFEENSAAADTRKKLRHELTALTNAENLLVNEFGMGFSISSDIASDRRIDTSSANEPALDEDFLHDIEAMNDDFLLFNQRMLGNSKPGPAPTTTQYRPPAPGPIPVPARPNQIAPTPPSYTPAQNGADPSKVSQPTPVAPQNRKIDPSFGQGSAGQNPQGTQAFTPASVPQRQPQVEVPPQRNAGPVREPDSGFTKPNPSQPPQQPLKPNPPPAPTPARDPWDVPLVGPGPGANARPAQPGNFATNPPPRPNATINLNPATGPAKPTPPAQSGKPRNNLFGDSF